MSSQNSLHCIDDKVVLKYIDKPDKLEKHLPFRKIPKSAMSRKANLSLKPDENNTVRMNRVYENLENTGTTLMSYSRTSNYWQKDVASRM